MKLNGSAQITAPPTAVWRHLTNPTALSDSLSWVASWQALDTDRFLVHGQWQFSGEKTPAIIPAEVTWNPDEATQTITIQANLTLSGETLPITVQVRLEDVGWGETAVHFTISLSSKNRFIRQMVKQTLPKLIDQSFSQIQTTLNNAR